MHYLTKKMHTLCQIQIELAEGDLLPKTGLAEPIVSSLF